MLVKHFNTWERYFDPKHPKHKYQVARHGWFIDRAHGEKLLDVGCSGGLALFLAAKKDGINELHGIDVCEKTNFDAIKRLACYKNKSISILLGTAENIPEESEYFDCVLCGETLEHVSDDKKAAAELSRVAKPGATLLVSVPKNGHLSKEHVRLYSKESLRKLILNAGFNIIEESEMKASVNGFYLLLQAVKI